jgi:hypothetical protein
MSKTQSSKNKFVVYLNGKGPYFLDHIQSIESMVRKYGQVSIEWREVSQKELLCRKREIHSI